MYNFSFKGANTTRRLQMSTLGIGPMKTEALILLLLTIFLEYVWLNGKHVVHFYLQKMKNMTVHQQRALLRVNDPGGNLGQDIAFYYGFFAWCRLFTFWTAWILLDNRAGFSWIHRIMMGVSGGVFLLVFLEALILGLWKLTEPYGEIEFLPVLLKWRKRAWIMTLVQDGAGWLSMLYLVLFVASELGFLVSSIP